MSVEKSTLMKISSEKNQNLKFKYKFDLYIYIYITCFNWSLAMLHILAMLPINKLTVLCFVYCQSLFFTCCKPQLLIKTKSFIKPSIAA